MRVPRTARWHGIAVLLVVVAVAACVWPARRATSFDPLIALRRD